MINTSSKNNSFICVDEVCDTQVMSCVECQAPAEQQVHPLKKYLRDLWINIQLFFETNKWDQNVTLKVGDSHYTMKMDQIEARWRNQ